MGATAVFHLTLATDAPACRRPDGLSVPLGARDAVLLAWLALQGTTPRARLAALLWPDSSEEQARNALRQRLFNLKKHCGAELLEGTAQLRLAPQVSHDLAAADSLLGSLQLAESPQLQAWLDKQRTQRSAHWRRQIELRIEAAEAQGDYGAALPLAQTLLDADPLSEDAYRRLMRLHYLRGDRAAALRAFDRCEQVLKDEVGTRPSAATLSLLATIDQGQPAEPAVPDTAAAAGPMPASVLRPPHMIGRDGELELLRAAARTASVAVVIGEAGMGKSRLLQALAADPGLSLVSTAARPGDGLAPYATLARFVGELRSRLSTPPQVAAQAASDAAWAWLPLGGRAAVQVEQDPAPLPLEGLRLRWGRADDAAAASSLIERVAQVRSLLRQVAPPVAGFVLDDLHFADDASLELLQALVCGVREADAATGLRALWLLAARPAATGSRLQHLMDAVAAAVPHSRVLLQPLTLAQMAALIDSLTLPGTPGALLAPALHQRTGGNPLFALETLKLAWADGSLHRAADLPRPQSLAQLIGQQLGRLSAPALNLVRVAAVAGVAFSVPLAERVLGRSVMDMVDAWQELEQQQVLRGNEFAHDLLHDAVLQSLPQPIARHLHGQVAHWLESQAGEPARIAAHWEAAGQLEHALPALFHAAARAHAASRAPERIAFLLRAADIAEATGERAKAFEAVQQAVESHMNILRDTKGFALLDRLDRLVGSAEERAVAAGHRAWYQGIVGDWATAAQAGQTALDLARDCRPALHAVLQQRLGASLGMLGRFDQALTQLRAAESGVSLYASPEEQAEFHGNLAVVLGNLGHVAEASVHHRHEIDSAATLASPSKCATALANFANNRFLAGDVPEAWRQAQLAQQHVASGNLNGSSAGFVAVQLCQSARVLGHLRDALAASERALSLVEQSNPGLLPPVRVARAHVWFDLGQFARVLQELNAGEAWERVAPRHQIRRLVLLARVAEVSDMPQAGEEMRAALAQAAAIVPVTGWPELGFMVALDRARMAAGEAAVILLEPVRAAAQRAGMRGIELSAEVRLADAWLRAAEGPAGAEAHGAPAPALLQAATHARRALELASHALPTLVPRAELWWHAGRALARADAVAAAQQAFAEGRAWLREVAARHVDEPFRAAFLERLPVHRALLATA